MATVASSSTWTRRPAGSPLGEASQFPAASEVAMTQNGEMASHSRSTSCSRVRSLVTARPPGVPSRSRSSPAEEISSKAMSSQLREDQVGVVLGHRRGRADEVLVRLADHVGVLALVVELQQDVLDRLDPGPLLVVAPDHRPG